MNRARHAGIARRSAPRRSGAGPSSGTAAELVYTDAGARPREGVDDPPVEVFVQPGELFVGDASFRPRTLLGSCVSITLWQPQRRCGGMSHFLLPSRGLGPVQALGSTRLDGRYGDEALESMLRQLSGWGVSAAQCEAKIFGGGDMFPERQPAPALQVGQRNGLAARALLQQAGIRVVSESLFGIGHRQIIFDLATGAVWSHQVKRTSAGAA
jgi:chemotaxis protein CheD